MKEQPATEKQLKLIAKLKAKHEVYRTIPIPELTKYEASELIGKLLGQNKKQRRQSRKDWITARQEEEKVAYNLRQIV